MRFGSDHNAGLSTQQVATSNGNDNGEPALQLTDDRANPADPAAASASCMQSPAGDDDNTIITSQDENVDIHDEVMMCAVLASNNDGE